MAYVPKGGLVPVHPWLLAFRFLQAILAIVVIATTTYPLSIQGGGPIHAPLICALIAAALTLLPILPLTTPLHTSQRRLYDPRIALLVDLVAALFWSASFVALATYLGVFSEYGKQLDVANGVFKVCGKCRGAWRSGVAAAVFTAVEFLLFLFTTLAFTYYYHCHLAGEPAYGIAGRKEGDGTHESTSAPSNSMSGPIADSLAFEHHLRAGPPYTHSEFLTHAPIPHVHVSNYGIFRTSHPPTSNYGAAPASDAGASPTADTPVSPALPPRSPSRLERTEGYGILSESHVGHSMDTMKPF